MTRSTRMILTALLPLLLSVSAPGARGGDDFGPVARQSDKAAAPGDEAPPAMAAPDAPGKADLGKSPDLARTDRPAPIETTFARGLRWLMKQQDAATGAWKGPGGDQAKPDVGFTAMAVCSLAGAPEELRREYGEAEQKAVAYLLKNQQENGSIYDKDQMPAFQNYKTSLAVMALCEADPEKHKDAVLRARKFLEGTQFSESFENITPDNPAYGAWEYDSKSGRPVGDLSNTQMTLQALKAAGTPPDDPVWKRAVKFIERCQNRSESNDMAARLDAQGITAADDGGFRYRPGESKASEKTADGRTVLHSYGSMTYAGLLSFIYAQVDKNDPRVQAALNWIRKQYTLEENPGLRMGGDAKMGKQGLYYYYHTFAKALAALGEKTVKTGTGDRAWAEDFVRHVASLQKEDGSWANDTGRWWEDYAPLSTCYVLMALNQARPFVAPGK